VVCTAMTPQTHWSFLVNPDNEHRVMYVAASRRQDDSALAAAERAGVRAVKTLLASQEEQTVEYPSSWDHRRLPLDLFGLDERKREVLIEWDRHGDEFKALEARIEDGRAKIAAVREASKPAEKIAAAEAMLPDPENQLRSLRWRYDLPCDALEPGLRGGQVADPASCRAFRSPSSRAEAKRHPQSDPLRTPARPEQMQLRVMLVEGYVMR
jgi:hypothetical protein